MLIIVQIRSEERRIILPQPFPVFLRIGAISALPGGKKKRLDFRDITRIIIEFVAKPFTKFNFKPITLKTCSSTSQGNDPSSVPDRTSDYLLPPLLEGLEHEIDD